MNKVGKKILLAITLFLFSAPFVYAAVVKSALFEPGGITSNTSFVGYIQTLYNAAFAIAGILALGMIVIGAIYRITSGGSPDRIREGTDYITSALWGLALLFGSYLILNTVNPQIVDLATLQQSYGNQLTPTTRPTILCADLPTADQKVWNNCIPNACAAGAVPCQPEQDPAKGDKCTICAYPSIHRCDETVEAACDGKKVEGGWINWYHLYYDKTSANYTTQCVKYAWKENKLDSKTELNQSITDALKPC